MSVRQIATGLETSLFSLWRGWTGAARERERQALYARVFGTPEGRRVLADIVMSAGYLAQPTPGEPNQVAFREGARWTVGMILETCGIGERAMTQAFLNDDLNEAFDD